jgi:hypothetical protein
LTAIELERRALRARLRVAVIAVPAWAWLSLLIAVSVAIRSALAFRNPAPWIFQDELVYSELAKSFAATGHFAIRESPGTGGFGIVYPLLISPAWAIFRRVPAAYDAARGINAVVMSLAAVPVYLLARRLVGRALALAAATLALALPGMAYTSTIMTENAFFPVFLFWVLAVVLAIERPTAGRQVAAVALTFLAYLTRTQGAVLVPALVTSIVVVVLLEAWNDDRGFRIALGRRAAAFAVTWGVLGAGIVGYLVWKHEAKGATVLSAVLGPYSTLSKSSYTVHDTLRWLLYHAGELDFAVGVLPVAAFIVLVVAALRRRPPSRETQVFAVVALSATIWLLVQVAAFATTAYGRQIQERNLFYLEPLFLIALVAWAGGILPRSPRLTGAAALVAAVLVGVVPYSSFLGPNEVANAFGLLPLWRAVDRGNIAASHLTEVIVLAGLAAGLLFLLLPRRLALIAPAVVLVYLAAANSPVVGKVRETSVESRYGGVQTQRDWIDRAVGTKPQVAAIWTNAPGLNFVTLWDNEFFNRSVGPVYNLHGPPDGLPQETITIDPRDTVARDPSGNVVRARYVLTDKSVNVAGRVVAQDPGLGMVLYRVDGPVRLIGGLDGVYPDSWSGPTVTYTRNPCVSGTLSVVLQGWRKLQPRPVTVVARSAGRVVRVVVPPTDAERTLSIPLRPLNELCQVAFSISPTAVPANVLGGPDTRQLGVRFKLTSFSPQH